MSDQTQESGSGDAEYARRLEDACLALWAELPAEQVRSLRDEAPALVEFLRHLHATIEHEQAMVRTNVWAKNDGSDDEALAVAAVARVDSDREG